MAEPVRSVGVLGTGIMGAPMARNMARQGLEVRAWNRTHERAAALGDDGVTVAGSPAEAADRADAIVTMLADGGAVEEAMVGGGAVDAMRDDAVWIQMSTVGLEATERLAALAAKRGLAFVDAPVLGTKRPAEAGELTVVGSGPEEERERCAPVFEAIGSKTSWLGEAGAGTRMKLVLNSWVLALTAGLGESVALAEGLDLDPAAFLETIDGAPMNAPYAQMKGRAMIERSFEPSFPCRLAAKDAALVVEAAEAAGLSPTLQRAVRESFARAVDEDHGDEDIAAVYRAAAR
jgi:3-hydroxyisobutyrate dehydrogenase